MSANPNSLINGRWYYKLKEGNNYSLCNSIPRNVLMNYFIVYKMENGKRLYGAFRSCVDFYIYYRELSPTKEYHEIIFGEKEQKPRFDIDIPYDKFEKSRPLRSLLIKEENNQNTEIEWIMMLGNRMVGKIIDAVKEVLKSYGLELNSSKDIAFYTSHSLNPPYKYSAHIIFPNYCHFNYEEAKEFYKLVVNAGGAPLKVAESCGILDGSIYASQKSFRMEGSTKNGKRPKKRSSLPYEGKIYNSPIINSPKDELFFFRESCITDSRSTTRLPVIVPEKKIFVNKVTLPSGVEDIIGPHIDGDFSIEEIKGGLIVLKRLRPTYCKLCNREHESDNPFLIVRKNGEVYFHCRSAIAERNSYKICNIDGVKITPLGNLEENNLTDRKSESIEIQESQTYELNEKMKNFSKNKPKIKKEGVNFDALTFIDYNKIENNNKKKRTILSINKFY